MKKQHRYLPSIDSLRAIAVISVIVYHANALVLPGGFLGVDLFFVLSGYLISSLIYREYRQTGKVNLYNFYLRRARRLLPAVYFMITVILIAMVLFNKTLLEKSHLDALFGYIYSSNWWYIFHELDYFDSFGSVSPFKHLWSLAIEEQFYMLFPLIFILTNLFAPKGKIANGFKYVVAVLLLISLFTHIYLFDINDINRVYYGTDTRAFSLLTGVLGALFYPMDKLELRVTKQANKVFSLVAAGSITVFIVLMFFLSEYSTFLYRGGFFLLSILFLIIIITAGHQNTVASRLLSFKPLVFIGKISYSLYLWHFPILVLTTPSGEQNDSNLLVNALKILLIFVVAYFSYRFVEMPIRKYGFINYVRILMQKIIKSSKPKRNSILTTCGIVFVLFVMGIFGKSMPILSTAFIETTNHNNSVVEFKTENNSNVQEVPANNSENKKYTKLIVIGDSLAVDIGNEVVARYAGAIIDGKVSRQVHASYDVTASYSSYNNENTAFVILLGTNGLFTEEQLDKLLKPLDKADIYFVNTKVPRNWESAVNSLLDESKSKYSNLTIVDWYSVAKNNTSYFAADRVHLQPSGAVALVDLISSSFKKEVETPEMIAEKERKEQERIAAEKAKQEAEQQANQNAGATNNIATQNTTTSNAVTQTNITTSTNNSGNGQ